MNDNIISEGGLSRSGLYSFNNESKLVVSIVTVVLNDPDGLTNTIESVLNQNYSNLEFIIIDGGSKEKTISVIKRFDDSIEYWSSEKDKGIYDAMNKGINISSGDIIGILNAGDCYCNNTFSIVQDAFNSSNHPQVVFGDVIMCKQNKDKLYTASVKKRIFKDGWMPHPAVFVKREVYEQFGRFDLKLRVSADYDFMLRIKSKTKMKYVEQPLAKMNIVGVSTSNYLLKAKENHYSRKKNGIPVIKNILLTAFSVLSQIISDFIRIIFGFPEFRFENNSLLLWVRKKQSVFMGNN